MSFSWSFLWESFWTPRAMWEMTHGRYPETTRGVETDSQNPSENQLKFWWVFTQLLWTATDQSSSRPRRGQRGRKLHRPFPTSSLKPSAKGTSTTSLTLLCLPPQSRQLLQFALIAEEGRLWAVEEAGAEPARSLQPSQANGERWGSGKQSPALPQPSRLPKGWPRLPCGYLPHSLLHNRRSQQPPVSVAPRVRSPLGTYFATHIINTLSNLLKQAWRQNECKHRHKTTDMWTNTWQSEDQNLPSAILKSPWLSKTSFAFYLWFTKDYVQQPIQYQSLNLKSLQSPTHQNISHGFISTNNEVNGRRIWPKPKQKPLTPLYCTKWAKDLWERQNHLAENHRCNIIYYQFHPQGKDNKKRLKKKKARE